MTIWSSKLVNQIYLFVSVLIINLCLTFCLDPQAGLRYASLCAPPPTTAVPSHIGVGYPPACAVSDKAGKITLSSYYDAGNLPSHVAHGRTTMTSQDSPEHPPAYTDPDTTAVMSQFGNSSQHTVPAEAIATYPGSE